MSKYCFSTTPQWQKALRNFGFTRGGIMLLRAFVQYLEEVYRFPKESRDSFESLVKEEITVRMWGH